MLRNLSKHLRSTQQHSFYSNLFHPSPRSTTSLFSFTQILLAPSSNKHQKQIQTRKNVSSSAKATTKKKHPEKRSSKKSSKPTPSKPFLASKMSSATTTTNKKKWYAVARGHRTGVFFESWTQVETFVKGFTNNKYKGFENEEAAKSWFTHETSTSSSSLSVFAAAAAATTNAEPKSTSKAVLQQQQRQQQTAATAVMMARRRERENQASDDDDDDDGNGGGGDDAVVVVASATSTPSSSTIFNLSQLSQLGSRLVTPTTDSSSSSSSSSEIKNISNFLESVQPPQGGTSFVALRVFTDGACSNNGKPTAIAGSGVVIVTGRAAAAASSSSFAQTFLPFAFPLHRNEPQTNQRSELTACIAVLAALERHDDERELLHQAQHQQRYNNTNNNNNNILAAQLSHFFLLNLSTDSQYCIKGATEWRHAWAQQKRKASSIQNVDLWRILFSLIDARERRLQRFLSRGNGASSIVPKAIEWNWVKGHQLKSVSKHCEQSQGNNAADKQAVKGSLLRATWNVDEDAKKTSAASFIVEGLKSIAPCDVFG